MPKQHMKRIAAPKTWNIGRKESTFITRPNPGGHKIAYCMPLSVVMRELIKVSRTAKESKQILHLKDVFVDKRKRVEDKYPVGLMDIIEFPQMEQQYRILLDNKGRIAAVPATAKETSTKLSKIESKTSVKGGKIQLNMSDGRNILIDKNNYGTGDTLQLSLPDQKITSHFPLEKGAMVLLIGGKYAGMVVAIDEICDDKIILKTSKNQKFETSKSYAFVVGKDKPVLDSINQLTKPAR
ncbi:30S ribosomal protein S4e [Candidatus Woesearchaeota archaeon]|nr:30S ribosomal protein S4e [Candidatus Woesearchaeota archaeon]